MSMERSTDGQPSPPASPRAAGSQLRLPAGAGSVGGISVGGSSPGGSVATLYSQQVGVPDSMGVKPAPFWEAGGPAATGASGVAHAQQVDR